MGVIGISLRRRESSHRGDSRLGVPNDDGWIIVSGRRSRRGWWEQMCLVVRQRKKVVD